MRVLSIQEMALSLEDELGFGKYENYTIKELIDVDFRYMQWLHSKGAEFGEDVFDRLSELNLEI